jgi:hypothetical protein
MKLRLALAALSLLTGFGAFAAVTNDLSDAEIQGRALAQKILEQWPATNTIQIGVLSIRSSKGTSTNIPIKCEIFVSEKHWDCYYEASLNDGSMEILDVNHGKSWANHYGHLNPAHNILLPIYQNSPFANSDFWVTDLGLEFFHWPEQKILKHEIRRSRACTVLESTNPNPSTNDYSRVVSWIDNETLGIVHAEAYDAKGRLLKEFDPKSFKKVNGQWELQEMEIRNDQTGSRTRLEFDVKKE